MFSLTLYLLFYFLPFAGAHFAAWHKGMSFPNVGATQVFAFLRVSYNPGMYCLNGTVNSGELYESVHNLSRSSRRTSKLSIYLYESVHNLQVE
ncbi:hypothetical protein C8R43DRAFT_471670 [Mycena crocata]|nr:hypothetical protein C8R43DRAFT_471670 [Mycena crocata]